MLLLELCALTKLAVVLSLSANYRARVSNHNPNCLRVSIIRGEYSTASQLYTSVMDSVARIEIDDGNRHTRKLGRDEIRRGQINQ